jgi:dihydrolipoamide dehydrogenase
MHVDVAIIGQEPYLSARRKAEKAGSSWALIDPGPLATTWARVGCIPSKLLT